MAGDKRMAGIAKGAAAALAGGAVLGIAGRAAVNRARRPRILGMPLPRSIKPGKLDPRKIDLKNVMKQLGDAAERVEHASEDVRVASAQAKRVTKKLS